MILRVAGEQGFGKNCALLIATLTRRDQTVGGKEMGFGSSARDGGLPKIVQGRH
jgi:hypothetical protein